MLILSGTQFTVKKEYANDRFATQIRTIIIITRGSLQPSLGGPANSVPFQLPSPSLQTTPHPSPHFTHPSFHPPHPSLHPPLPLTSPTPPPHFTHPLPLTSPTPSLSLHPPLPSPHFTHPSPSLFLPSQSLLFSPQQHFPQLLKIDITKPYGIEMRKNSVKKASDTRKRRSISVEKSQFFHEIETTRQQNIAAAYQHFFCAWLVRISIP